ncbi:MAG: transporter substrate-binding protein [Alphaproteobacteria bacterium]|jgi:TRAP-type C4-dicarboxylate transport system substrate-binding protein|nr:transporter substrate-binding protein [Alphaproteobacteria bacterium]
MSRIRALAAVLCAGLAFSTAVAAKDIKISHQFKQGDARDEATRLFVAEVVKRDPSLKFRIFPNRSLIAAPFEQLAAMRDGSVEMAVYPINYGGGQVPEFSVTTLPGVIRGLEHGLALRDSDFAKTLNDVAMANGVRIVTWWWTPLGFVMKQKTFAGPNSVAGLKMRGADAYVDLLLKEQGASVVAMAGTELYSAMQSGILDGFLTSTESMYTNRFYEVGKSATLGGQYNFATSLQPLMMSKKHWDELTEAQKKIFDEAARISEKHFTEVQSKAIAQAVEAFKKANLEVHELTKAEFDAWVDVARKQAWAKFEKDAAKGADLLRQAAAVK